jgi:hypothetical protein
MLGTGSFPEWISCPGQSVNTNNTRTGQDYLVAGHKQIVHGNFAQGSRWPRFFGAKKELIASPKVFGSHGIATTSCCVFWLKISEIDIVSFCQIF